MGKTVNEQISKGRTLCEGLKSKISEVESRGISSEMIEKLETLCSKTATEGEEQDRIKDMYHAKTAEVSKLMAELKDSIATIKRAIKPYYPQNEWIKFGIEDKK